MEIISYVGGGAKPNVREKIRRISNPVSPMLILKKCGDLLWVLPVAAILFLLPLGISKLINLMQSRVSPLTLQLEGSEELNYLDNLMANFALESGFDCDEDGNILSPSTETLPLIKIQEPVKYQNYKVKSGETLGGISRKFGLKNISTLIAVNNISNVRQVYSGQTLKIPSTDGLVHKVAAGNTLEGISAKYGIAVEDILDVNDLDSQVLVLNQEIFIPGAKLDRSTLQKAMGQVFINPLIIKWRFTSGFGYRADPFTGVRQFHNGVDLAVPQGTPVQAVMAGKVMLSGWSNVYGNYVIIDHGNGYQTMYGHLQKKLVSKGATVNQGERIGLVGSTGYSTGPHLHFTVYKNSKAINPVPFLK